MKTYTREQLIDAMEKYYSEVNENPDKFSNSESIKEDATGCIDYLIELINDDTEEVDESYYWSEADEEEKTN